MIRFPPPTLPVKHDLAHARVADEHRPQHGVVAGDDVDTPGGSSAAISATVRTNDSGVVGGALTTTVLPATSACGSDAARIASGQLNGTIRLTTPSGRWETCVRNGGAGISRTPSTTPARPAASSKRLSITCISISHSERTLPFSRESSSTRSSLSAASAPRLARTRAARSSAPSAAHAGKASCAAATARRACSSPAAPA